MFINRPRLDSNLIPFQSEAANRATTLQRDSIIVNGITIIKKDLLKSQVIIILIKLHSCDKTISKVNLQ